jgi:hypothetical protein
MVCHAGPRHDGRHLIHLEEWLDSPVQKGSDIALRSGTLLQCDIIPVLEDERFAINAEDTVALADEELRAEIAEHYPEMWMRIERRRAYVRRTWGLQLAPEVLPFSNLVGYVPPFLLSPDVAVTLALGSTR